MDLNVITMPVGDLIPYANNPRNNDDAVDLVAASIRDFGFKVPIIVDKDNVIVAGHTRLRAAKQLGLDSVPVIKADDLTEEQVKAFRLADNKVAEFSEWDEELLSSELIGLPELSMSDYGFPSLEFNDSVLDYFTSGDREENDVGGYIDRTFFTMTFVFPIEFEEKLKAYVKEKGKDVVSELIMDLIEKDGVE